ncbi:ankyrin repeat-containing domain protein [Xylaria sp. FL0064]|nr:ankyrin repeat-containing domain protein [Xylaria sp. FL0064]
MPAQLGPIAGIAHTQRDFSLFEEHRAQLRRLYLEQDKSLKKVKEEMEKYHGFPEVDAKIYEYGLRHLGFIKKLSIEQWVQVDVLVKKRKEREGKETDIVLSGMLQHPDKINRIISRNKRRRYLQDQIGRGTTPECPENVLLTTPPSSPSSPNMTMIDPWDDVTYYLHDLTDAWEDDEFYAYGTIFPNDKTKTTMARLIVAAHSGMEQLLLYLNSRSTIARKRRRIHLEIALSLAAGLGDIAAIRAFGEANVDPNARTLLSKIKEKRRVIFHPLIRAATEKHLDAVRLLIGMGCELRSEVEFFNPLTEAIFTPKPLRGEKRKQQLEIVKYFLSQNLATEYGRDAMIQALVPPCASEWEPVEYDFETDEEIIDMLFEAGIVLNDITANGKDLLHFAIDSSCDLKIVENLVSRGAEIHSRPCLQDGKTMLHSAAASDSDDRQKIVELLLRSRADCRAEYGGHTILESALSVEGLMVTDSSVRLYSLLLDHGAQLNGPAERLPEKALGGSWAPVVTRLLYMDVPDELILQIIQAGANINSPGSPSRGTARYTPLQCAIKWGRLDVARQLIARGADINAPAHGDYGYTALQAACHPSPGVEINVQFIQFLLDSGADINAPGARVPGKTALQCAVEAGSMGAVCLLLDAGAHIIGTVEYSTVKSSALSTAAKRGSLDMVDMMLKKLAGNTKCGREPYEDAARVAEHWSYFAIAKMIRESIAEPVAR